MSGGPHYTKDENERLLSLWADNKDSDYTEIAKKAKAYGCCIGSRTESAIARHLSVLLLNKQGDENEIAEEDTENDQLDMDDIILRKKAALYDSVCDMYFGTLSLGYSNGKEFLNLNIPEIRRWFEEHEPERNSKRLDELRAESRGR